jgi:hypothetical protein
MKNNVITSVKFLYDFITGTLNPLYCARRPGM